MLVNILHSLASTRTLIAGHPVISVLGLGFLFAISSLIGEAILYWLARLGGRPLVFQYSRWLRLDAQKIDRVEALFARWGMRLIFFGRFLPGVKTVLPVPAGMSRMSFGVYLGMTFSAAYLYNILWFAGAFLLGHKITMFGVSIL